MKQVAYESLPSSDILLTVSPPGLNVSLVAGATPAAKTLVLTNLGEAALAWRLVEVDVPALVCDAAVLISDVVLVRVGGHGRVSGDIFTLASMGGSYAFLNGVHVVDSVYDATSFYFAFTHGDVGTEDPEGTCRGALSPFLSASPAGGTLAAGATQTVTLTFSAAIAAGLVVKTFQVQDTAHGNAVVATFAMTIAGR